MAKRDVLLTGAGGFLGLHVSAALDARVINYWGLQRDEVDLRVWRDVEGTFQYYAPKTVIHLAAPTPGGIGQMQANPLLIADMARIDANVVEACARAKVERLITVGSLCSYDPFASINGPYGVAKRYLHALCEAAHRQYGLAYTFLELTNLYGPGDRSQHVIPATIRKLLRARKFGERPVIWGKALDTRAFCYVEDAARGIVDALDDTGVQADILGPWTVQAIGRLVGDLGARIGYTGPLTFDASKPSTARVTPEMTRVASRETPLAQGLALTVDWWLANPEPLPTEESTQP